MNGPPETKRADATRVFEVSLYPPLPDYLDDLVATGLYGETREDAAVELIVAGLRRAIADGLIGLRGGDGWRSGGGDGWQSGEVG